MFAALAENPEFFRPKLKLFVSIAPVVRVSYLGS
jgi:lysosomal acid lipase/cholesteryl ester hydrolase